jgi:desert hedgehog protein
MATIEHEYGKHKTMDELSVGDRVLVSDNSYSDVYMFGHKDSTAVSTFVYIATSANQTISLSPNHYIHANGKLVAASAVFLGEC